jgi:P-type conjugative transfer protein TrbG
MIAVSIVLIAHGLVAAPVINPAEDRLAVPGGSRVFVYEEASIYSLVAMPGRVTDVVLEPGEALVASGAIATGDSARWIIGDTSSGAGGQRRVHVLVKPTQSGLSTNLLINTDRRTYHLELRASARTWLSQVAWRYPAPHVEPILIAAPPASAPMSWNLAYKIRGDRPLWRPLRVFDDGQRTYVEFGPHAVMDALPPLYLTGPDGKSAELVNYSVDGRRLVLHRLFDQAELRLGHKRGDQRVRLIRQAAPGRAGQ